MRKSLIVLSAVLAGLLSVPSARAQYLESVIRMPDSLGGVSYPCCVAYGGPDSAVFAAGYGPSVIRIDARNIAKNGRTSAPDVEWTDMAYCEPHRRLYVVGSGYRSDTTLVVLDASSMEMVSAFVTPDFDFEVLLYNPLTDRVYCTGWQVGGLYLFDARTGELDTVIRLSNGITGLCLDPVNNRVYCADGGRSRVMVFDGETDSLLLDWQAGPGPGAMAYNETDNKFYCAIRSQGAVVTLDGLTLEPGPRLPVTQPRAVCWDRVGDKVYCGGSDAFYVFDGPGNTLVARIELPPYADIREMLHAPVSNRVFGHDYQTSLLHVVDADNDTLIGVVPAEELETGLAMLCFDPVHDRVYRVVRSWSALQVIDGRNGTEVAQVSLTGDRPGDLCVNPVTNRIYVTSYSGKVAVIDGEAQELVASPNVWQHVSSVACAWDLDKVYCYGYSRLDSGYVLGWAVIDGSTNEVVDTLWSPRHPEFTVYNPVEHKLYLSDDRDGVHVLDCVRDTVYRSVALGDNSCPQHLAYCPTENKVYCAAYGYDMVAAIDCRTDRVVGWFHVGEEPGQMAWNPRNNRLYCPSEDSDSGLVVVDCTGDTVIDWLDVSRALTAACDPVRNEVYVASGAESLYVIDAAAGAIVSRVHLRDYMNLLAVDTIAGKVYVTDDYLSAVEVYDPVSDSIVASIEVPSKLCGLVANPADTRVYVPCNDDCSVAVLNSGAPGLQERGDVTAMTGRRLLTIVRGVIRIEDRMPDAGYRAGLLDISGRKVMDLQAGDNNIRHLAPGVYFVRSAESGQRPAVHRVVIAR